MVARHNPSTNPCPQIQIFIHRAFTLSAYLWTPLIHGGYYA